MRTFLRDMNYDTASSGTMTTNDDCESYVKRMCPNAFMKITIGKKPKWYIYQIRIRTGWFTSKPLGDEHYFRDQAWASAYKKLVDN